MMCFLKFLIIGFLSINTAPNNSSFEGIIKYKSTDSASGVNDTLIYYFGKNKIRVDRIGRLSKSYGSYSNVYYDFEKFPNISFLWSEEKNQLTKIEHSKTWVKKNEEFSDTSIIQLEHNCHLRKIEYFSSYNDGYQYDTIEEIWFAENLRYEISTGWNFLENIFSNGSNCITLYKIRDVKSDNPDAIDKKNILMAYEIIPKSLDSTIFEIPSN